MFDRDAWLEILQVILKNPFRSALSGIGVGWGVFMIIITFACTTGLENGIKQDLPNRAGNSMFMWSQGTSMPYKGFKSGRYFELENSDVDYLKANVKEVTLVSPRASLGGYRGTNNVTYKGKSGACNVYGDTPDYIKIEPINIWKGRYLNDLDLSEKRKVCVIGERVFKVLFGGEKAIGEFIQIGGINFKVIGVYKSVKTGEDAEEDTQSIFVPLTTFQQSFNYGTVIGWMSILLDTQYPNEQSEEAVLSALKIRKKIHPEDRRAFGYWTMAERMEEIDLIFGALKIVAFCFGGLALLAGVIGICNIMLVTIGERTKEFGVRRSLGATPWTVIKQVLSETIFMTVVFGCVGMIFGSLTVELLNYALDSVGDTGSFRSPTVGYQITLMIFITMSVMGVLAGLLPAYMAVQIKPVEALRTE
ncbi:MAG: ABC transporter permease [Flavobacteriales bacterium]